jgi:predicted transcriptional regulator
MDVEALDTLEHVDMNDVLGDQSMYPDENEVLYPPFLYLDTELLLLTSEEEQLRDIHGNPPYGKVHVMLKGSTIVVQDLTEEEKEAAAKAEEEKKAAGLVKVKAQRRFLDKELNQIKDTGDEYAVSRERAAVLEEAGVAAVIEE